MVDALSKQNCKVSKAVSVPVSCYLGTRGFKGVFRMHTSQLLITKKYGIPNKQNKLLSFRSPQNCPAPRQDNGTFEVSSGRKFERLNQREGFGDGILTARITK